MKSKDREKNHYEVLNVSPQAEADEIRRAFRKGAFQWHPDRNPDDQRAEEMFKRINEAYRILGDDQTRRLYDRHLSNGGSTLGFSDRSGRWEGPFGRGQGPFPPGRGWGAGFGGCRRGMGGGCGRRRYASSMDGSYGRFSDPFEARPFFGFSENATLKLSREEAANGCERTIYVQSGPDRAGLVLEIPAGIENGSLLRVVTQGPRAREILLRVQVR
jgi:curved DNA-binding protein CbpA